MNRFRIDEILKMRYLFHLRFLVLYVLICYMEIILIVSYQYFIVIICKIAVLFAEEDLNKDRNVH